MLKVNGRWWVRSMGDERVSMDLYDENAAGTRSINERIRLSNKKR